LATTSKQQTASGLPALLVLASTFPGTPNDGTPAFVLDLAREEAKRFDVTVLTPMVAGAARTEIIDGVRVIRYRYFFKRFEDLATGAILDNLKAKPIRALQILPLVVSLTWSVFRLNQRLKPAAIHAHWVIPQGLAARIAAPRTPLLVTTHGGDIYALNNSLLLEVKREVFKSAKRITTVNSEMKRSLVERGLPAEKISVLPMGVDTKTVGDLAAKTKVIPGKLLVVGRLVEKKGIAFLLDALREPELASRLGSIKLTIVGDGPLRGWLASEAKGLPVEFVGQQGRDQVLRHIAEAELMVIPSVTADSGDQEGLPVTLLEGGAGAVCVIASNLPGIDEVIVDGESGLLVPQRDVPALAGALARALEDGELRRRLAAGIAKSVKRFDIATIGAAYCDELDKAIEASR
jgi:glycosyltransferase involved in cell wall biosynthesis